MTRNEATKVIELIDLTWKKAFDHLRDDQELPLLDEFEHHLQKFTLTEARTAIYQIRSSQKSYKQAPSAGDVADKCRENRGSHQNPTRNSQGLSDEHFREHIRHLRDDRGLVPVLTPLPEGNASLSFFKLSDVETVSNRKVWLRGMTFPHYWPREHPYTGIKFEPTGASQRTSYGSYQGYSKPKVSVFIDDLTDKIGMTNA